MDPKASLLPTTPLVPQGMDPKASLLPTTPLVPQGMVGTWRIGLAME